MALRENCLHGPPLIIKQQMSDRFANFVFQNYIVMYRKNLVTLYRFVSVQLWSFNFSGQFLNNLILLKLCPIFCMYTVKAQEISFYSIDCSEKKLNEFCPLMAIPVMEFQVLEYKIKKMFA